MSSDNREILEKLKAELDFVEQGGYGRSVRTPWQATSVFQDSPSCLNFDDPARPHPCIECWLMDFVPGADQAKDVPCHFIPVGANGETLDALEQRNNQIALEGVLKTWLRLKIQQIEQQDALQTN